MNDPARKTNQIWALIAWQALFLLAGASPAMGAGLKQLSGHVPSVVHSLQPLGNVPGTNEIALAIGVPLRDSAGLDQYLAGLYDPASPLYHHYLTPAEFTAKFSATEADYAAVKAFALTNGFQITGTYDNRLLLGVTARVGDVEKAFHLHLKKFKHPTEERDFFAPDTDPSVDSALAVADVQGLTDYVRPHPKLHRNQKLARSLNGSAPDGSGSYFGNDFRQAYASGTSLTGAGQVVGLFEEDGYYANDIAAYAQQAGNGRTSIQIQTVKIGSSNWSIGVNGGNGEVSLDIELAMAIAPGLSKIEVFEGPLAANIPNTILNAMAASNTVKCLSCSWGWQGGPSATTDAIFKNMAAQGQSFFSASGDSDAFTAGASSANGVDNSGLYNAPSSSPYIIQAGATTLTMNGTGASYGSETVWNWGYVSSEGYVGSSGGVSSYYPIPSWQTNISMSANLGSTSQRNIPDVTMAGDEIYVISGGGAQGSGGWGGTSCAAPLWAGFVALANQQAVQAGGSPAGFINPAIYAIGRGANPQYSYAACFHDVTSGNNEWSSSPSLYSATTGYDLCSGWGSPGGTNLLNALAAPQDSLVITPAAGFTASGIAGGPFSGAPQTLTLTNAGGSSFGWSLINTSSWLAVSASSGTLAAGKQTNLVASLAAAASALVPGAYAASVLLSNLATHLAQPRQFSLQVLSPLTVSPSKGFVASGPVGGDFNATAENLIITNLGAMTLDWGIVNTSLWLTASPPAGSLAPGANVACAISLTSQADALPAGVYTASILVTNSGEVSASLSFTLQVGQSVIANGGFETADFTGWTLSGDTTVGGTVFDGVEGSSFVTGAGVSYVHSGQYGAVLGESGSRATLSQSVSTAPGQSYWLSLWLNNPTSSTTQIFSVDWSSNSSTYITLFGITNPPAFSWTNLTFLVTATGSNSTVRFAAENDNDYFGLDDVSLAPVPHPSFTALARAGNLLVFSWNSITNASCVVQYKTNLLQANWINLVTNASAAGTTSFTNTIGADPRRFYRIWLKP